MNDNRIDSNSEMKEHTTVHSKPQTTGDNYNRLHRDPPHPRYNIEWVRDMKLDVSSIREILTFISSEIKDTNRKIESLSIRREESTRETQLRMWFNRLSRMIGESKIRHSKIGDIREVKKTIKLLSFVQRATSKIAIILRNESNNKEISKRLLQLRSYILGEISEIKSFIIWRSLGRHSITDWSF